MEKRMNRREFLAATAAAPLLAQAGRPGLAVRVHARGLLQRLRFPDRHGGYSKAGIRAVEVVLAKAREFAGKESPAAARRLLNEFGLKAASSSNHTGAVEPNPDRAKNLDDLKAKCELAQVLGADELWSSRR